MISLIFRFLGRWVILLVVYVVGLTAFIVTASLSRSHRPVCLGRPNSKHRFPIEFPRRPTPVSLRFAMVHDVIHERFAKHGRADYEARNRLVLQALEKERTATRQTVPAYFALLDVISACLGLNAVGEQDEQQFASMPRQVEGTRGLQSPKESSFTQLTPTSARFLCLASFVMSTTPSLRTPSSTPGGFGFDPQGDCDQPRCPFWA